VPGVLGDYADFLYMSIKPRKSKIIIIRANEQAQNYRLLKVVAECPTLDVETLCT
jgi:hypothetical protein